MDAVLSQQELKKIFAQVVREVTEQEAGIFLCLEEELPVGDFYMVHIDFEEGFHSGLSLCADADTLTRLTQNMMQEEEITPQDMADFTKEYFNVLCGQIAAKLFCVTQVASRFGPPVFYKENNQPIDHREQFALGFSGDRNEHVKLIHHTADVRQRTDGKGIQKESVSPAGKAKDSEH